MSAAASPLLELKGLHVSLDRLIYQFDPNDSSPDKPHRFIYFISIHNDSDVMVTIRHRKWVVAHDDGTVLVLEGDGVVGETPELIPGQRFSYHSAHAIGTRFAHVDGAYFGSDSQGRQVFVRIPRFELVVPSESPEA